jgi:gluconokinase
MNECITGVDIGTGSTKAVAVNNEGKVIASSQFYYPTNNPQPGYSEQDPEMIWQAFVNCIHEIITKTGQVPAGVSFSSAMHSLLVIDNKNVAITPVITWADSRSDYVAERIRKSPVGKKIYKATGTPLHSMAPLCKIIWLKEKEPQIFNAAFKFISIKEFIWYRLFNAYQVDHSIASATGLFNIKKRDWNKASLQLCDITADLLSEIVATGFIRKDPDPSTAATLQIPADTPFCIGASDGCLANIGSYATEPGIAALTIGTSAAVRIAGTKPVENYSAMIFNYVLDNKIFITGGPVNNGGNVLKWLFEIFLNNKKPSENDYDDFFKAAETVPCGSGGLLFLPYLTGERAPVWDEKASGVFLGIKSYHTRAHFLRAALEGICFTLKHILETIEVSTVPITQLNAGGGFVHSKIWMQVLADVTGKKIVQLQTEDASSVGAVLLYMKVTEIIKDYSSIKPPLHHITEPDLNNHTLYQKYFNVFKTMYGQFKDLMHQLYDINELNRQ